MLDTGNNDCQGNFLEDLWFAISSRRWLISMVALVTVFSVYVTLQLLTERYEAKASLLVKLGRENAGLSPTVDKGGLISSGVRKEDINSEIQLISSRALAEAVVDRLGPDAFKFDPAPPKTTWETVKYQVKRSIRWVKSEFESFMVLLGIKRALSDREKAVNAVGDALKVDREKDSDVIGVSLRMPSPDFSTQVLNVVLQLYLDKHVEVRRDAKVREFFDAQLEDTRKRLHEIEQLRGSTKTRSGVSSLIEQRNLLLHRLSDLRQQIEGNERERNLLKAPQASSTGSSAKASTPDGLTSSPSFEMFKKRVTELRVKRGELLQHYLPDAPVVQDIDQEISSIETMQRIGMDGLLGQLRAQAAAIENKLAGLNESERMLDTLERERVLATDIYLNYGKRREEARIAEELDFRRVSNIVVLEPPTKSLEPVYPRKFLIMTISIPFGLLLGLALALTLEYMDNRIRTKRDLDGLSGIVYLGNLRMS